MNFLIVLLSLMIARGFAESAVDPYPPAAGPAANASTPDLAKINWPSFYELREEHTPARNEELRRLIWLTPLGVLMKDYLFGSNTPQQTNRLARRIVFRLYSSGPLAPGRRTAIEMMKQDLHERNLMTEKVLLLFDQLENSQVLKKGVISEHRGERLKFNYILPALFGLAVGTSAVRAAYLEKLANFFARASYYRSEEKALQMLEKAAEWNARAGKIRRGGYSVKSFIEGTTAGVGAELGLSGFFSTGKIDDEALFSFYFNKSLQLMSSIEYL